MNGMERLSAALRGLSYDRVPVFCNLLDQGAAELGLPMREYYADGAHVAEAQLRMRQKYGHDNVWCLFYVGKEAELFGCKSIYYAENGPPNVGDWVIKSYDDIGRLEAPVDLAGHPAFEEDLKCLRILRAEVGGRYPICAYVTASMAVPALLMGIDHWIELLFTGPTSLRDELLSKCHAFFVNKMRLYREAGVDVFVYSNPFGSLETVPRAFFDTHALPWIERDIAAVGTAGMVYYAGMAPMGAVLGDVLARTGIGAYYLSPFDAIGPCKALLSGRALTCGVINDIRLIDWTREQVRAEVKHMMDAGAPGGRFLFGTGVMPYAIPEENIRWMLEAAFEFGSASRWDFP